MSETVHVIEPLGAGTPGPNKFLNGDRSWSSVSYLDITNKPSVSDLSGVLPIGSGGTGQSNKTPAFDALSPSTTKGDLIAHDGSDNVRIAVGSDGQLLVSDSSAPAGWSCGWRPNSIAMLDGTLSLVLTLLPAADTLLSLGTVLLADLASFRKVRLQAVKLGVAGSAGSELHLRYRTAFSSTVGDYAIMGSSAVKVALTGTNTGVNSGWIDLVAGARADNLWLALVTTGGSGLVSPVLGGVRVEFQ